MSNVVVYKPDNGLVTGMGGLLMSAGTAKVAYLVARNYGRALAAQAALSEAEARGAELPPGRITKLFSRPTYQPAVSVINDLGHANMRRTERVEVTGNYEGKDQSTGFPKSSPVTIELGSHYNEGTKQDRPALRVMGRALAKFAATHPGIRMNRR